MKFISAVLFFVFGFLFQHAFGQHKIYLLNGKQREGKIIATDVKYLGYEKKGKITKIKSGAVDYYAVDDKIVKPYDQIHFLNGRVLNAEVERSDAKYIYYTELGIPHKAKKERVFSIVKKGEEQVLFETLYTDEDTVEVEEARAFICGRRLARNHYHQPWAAIANTAISIGAGYFMAYYGIVVPAAFTAIDVAINPRMGKYFTKRADPKYLNDMNYKAGYNRQVKNLKVRNDLIGGFTGLAAGVSTLIYIRNNSK